MAQFNRGTFLMFLLFFLFFSPSGAPPRLMSIEERARLNEHFEHLQYQLEVLGNSTWSSGYGNLTGLTQEYPEDPAQPGSILPRSVYDKARELWDYEAEASRHHSRDDDHDDWRDPDSEETTAPDAASTDSATPDGHWWNHAPGEPNPSSYPDSPYQPKEHHRERTYFSNISSTLRGEWTAMDEKLTPIPMPLPAYVGRNDGRDDEPRRNESIESWESRQDSMDLGFEYLTPGNRTEHAGRLSVSLKELPNQYPHYQPNQSVSLITMDISLSDENGDNGNDLYLRGLHVKETGNIVLTTTSLKFSGIAALAHMLLDEDPFDLSKNITYQYLNHTLDGLMENPFYGILERAEIMADSCEYVLYGHVHSSGLSHHELQEVEDELADPQGRPHPKVPSVKLDAVLYSPDCGLSMTVQSMEGEKYENFFWRVRLAIVAGLVLLLLQTIVTAYQMKDTNTPSTISRVSFYTIGLMAILDGSICMSALVSSFVEQIAMPFMAVAFVSFALTTLFEIRYLSMIYRSQMMESVADARAREVIAQNGASRFVARPDGTIVSDTPVRGSPAPAGQSAVPGVEALDGALPVPVTTPLPPRTPVVVEQDERQIFSLIYSRFYFSLLGFTLVSLIVSSWPAMFRRIYEYVVVTILFSLWVPQIYRNVMRGSRKSFLWVYVVATSIIRLIPLVYFCFDEANVARHHYDPMLAYIEAGWLWVQIMILLAQSVFGPRFFLPSGLLPPLYDYHPILTEEDLESGFNFQADAEANPVALKVNNDVHSNSSVDSLEPLLDNRPKTDCAICMNPVELIVLPRDAAHTALVPANILARRQYMVTPCRHVFHTDCMEQWMRTRLQCPVCRNPLPPI